MARYQRELASAVSVPVFTSSRILVPLVFRMLSADKTVGILTIDSASVTRTELVAAGVPTDMPVVVAGMDAEEEFHRAILEDWVALDVERSRAEHVRVASRLVATHPSVGAIVLECTNMPPYRTDIQRATGMGRPGHIGAARSVRAGAQPCPRAQRVDVGWSALLGGTRRSFWSIKNSRLRQPTPSQDIKHFLHTGYVADVSPYY